MNNVFEMISCNALKEASLFQFIYFWKINENNSKTEQLGLHYVYLSFFDKAKL